MHSSRTCCLPADYATLARMLCVTITSEVRPTSPSPLLLPCPPSAPLPPYFPQEEMLATDVKEREKCWQSGRQAGRQEGVIFNSAKLLRIESENTRHLDGLPHPPHLSSKSRRLGVKCKRSLTRLQCDYEAGFTQCSPKNLPIAFKLA